MEKVYRSPLPRSPNEYVLRLGLQSTAHHNFTRNVPGVLVPHVDKLISGSVEGFAVLSRVSPKLHQHVMEAIEQAVKDFNHGVSGS
jgi:hypothetical protein